jgi:hypothetical protein
MQRLARSQARETRLQPGRHAEIVPREGSHYILIDGQEWSRHGDLAKAEAVRHAIVGRWAAEYDRRAAEEYER